MKLWKSITYQHHADGYLAPRSHHSVGEPSFVIQDVVEMDSPKQQSHGKAGSTLPPKELPEKRPEPQPKGRPSFKLRSPKKETSGAKKPVTSKTPGQVAAPTPRHQQHNENIQPTPSQSTPLNQEEEPRQPWSPADNPAATGQGPSLSSDPLFKPKPSLRPHRLHRYFRRVGRMTSGPSERCISMKRQ